MSSKASSCPYCKSSNIVNESGASICADCGAVIEESEVTFVEGTNGASSVVGQFISSATGLPVSYGKSGGLGRGFRKGGYGMSKESREATIENGRRKISQVAATLKLSTHHIEAAQRLFMLAVQHNFIQGRKTQNVIAACLYIVCRREKTPHLLIDFSDVLQTNVYVLGHTFLKFCRLLNLQLPIIDPSLYIQRFAAKLEFEDKTNVVANTALRIVQRMKRDWIQTGRRPSGICGAAILISARLHGFRRSQKDIIQVVKICDVTLRKRLYEFEDTPSGALTAEQFESIGVDLEVECDPPSFTRSRKKEELKNSKVKDQESIPEGKKIPEKQESSLDSNIMDEPDPESISLDDLEKEMQEALSSNEFKVLENDSILQEDLLKKSENLTPISTPISTPATPSVPVKQTTTSTSSSTTPVSKLETEEVSSEEIGNGLDDKEIESYINSTEEVKLKTELWEELNKDYLELLASRNKLKGSDDDPDGVRVKRKRKRETKKESTAESAAEATMEVLKKKVSRPSTKINYSALEGLFAVDEKMFDPKTTKMEKLGNRSKEEEGMED